MVLDNGNSEEESPSHQPHRHTEDDMTSTTHQPRHSHPYSVVYDNDREYDGRIPRHKLSECEECHNRGGVPMWNALLGRLSAVCEHCHAGYV